MEILANDKLIILILVVSATRNKGIENDINETENGVNCCMNGRLWISVRAGLFDWCLFSCWCVRWIMQLDFVVLSKWNSCILYSQFLFKVFLFAFLGDIGGSMENKLYTLLSNQISYNDYQHVPEKMQTSVIIWKKAAAA